MIYRYGNRSIKKLVTCHPALKRIAEEALHLSPYDITIIHGWRNMELQNKLYDENKSKKIFPDSKHNKSSDPMIRRGANRMSDALDFAPYINGINWEDTHIFAVVAGCFMAAAKSLGYTLRWGGDWDMDGSTTDQSFMDWGHIELVWE